MTRDITLDELARVFAQGRATQRAIYGQESSGGRNTGMSPDRAFGPMQVIEPTFNRFAQAGERWTNQTDNYNVGQRMIDQFALQYGGDPGRIATAYFSGEGNVAPPGSPLPYRRNPSDSLGTSTASYVGSIFRRLNPVSQAQAAPPAGMSFDDAVSDFLGQRGQGPGAVTMTPPAGGTDSPPLSLDDAAAHFLSTLPTPAAAPATAESEGVTRPQGPQPLPSEAAAPLPSADTLPGGAFARVDRAAEMSRAAGSMMNEYSAVDQGVTPPSATGQEPIGTVAVDDGGRTIIDPGGGKPWQLFDPAKHVMFRGPDGQPTAYTRDQQNEEGMLTRLGRLLKAGMIWQDRGIPTPSAPAPSTPAPPPAPVAHWSAAQPRDALGRFVKK